MFRHSRGERRARAGQTFRADLQVQERGREKVSAVQSALTDVLYIACHFILLEYWGVAKLKPRRYSNPSSVPLPGLVGGGLKSHLEACNHYSSHPAPFKRYPSKAAIVGRPLIQSAARFCPQSSMAPTQTDSLNENHQFW